MSEYGVRLDGNIANLVARLKAKRYKPKPVKRGYIPKPNGDKRRRRSGIIEMKECAKKPVKTQVLNKEFINIEHE